MIRAYWNPTRNIVENGAFEKLPALLESFKPKKILLALGQKSFRVSPYFRRLQEMLRPYEVLEAASIPQNPAQDFVQKEIDRLKKESYDLVLAIGGGSVLDVSKILAVIPRQDKTDLADYLDKNFDVPQPGAPLVAVPTTAGTGSEVTPFSSLETREKKKFSIGHAAFYPAVALVDPELCLSMPAYVTASTGFDALSQAIESFWSVNATPLSQTHSLRALELILSGFEQVMKNPADKDARFAMSLGSCEAGLGIAQAKTTAVHSVSYPITAHFGVAHGHACALTLPSFVRFNAPALQAGGKPLLQRFQTPDYDAMARKIEALMEFVGLERSLSKLGIADKEREVILRDGFRPDRIKNNPRPVEAGDLRKILESIR
ncbi:MAG TPA: iron-containing alcohol dehydrogenase [Verrucomicrobiae bacterium]|jgi:alcohol dehydrogenase class IV|nr:iron-containing alcohol dehydrogenase [Verrucomicrobiae bacterium]